MKAHIITIGDEILIGQIVDTNSAYISKVLNVVFNQEVLDHVEHLFKKYVKKPLLEANKTQALVPSKATILKNHFGTAPGMWMEQDGKVFISMPGVPHEMKGLMEHEVLPRLKEKFHLPYILHKTLLTYGMGESSIAERIEAFENELPKEIKLAYLPSLGRVRLRLSTSGAVKEDVDAAMEAQLEKLVPLVEDIFVGYEENGPLEVLVGEALTAQGKTLSIAESCTGGSVVQRFTSNPGASKYLIGSMVTYATQSKVDVLEVDKDLIDKHSVVSAEVAEAMAIQVKKLYNTDYAITTTLIRL